MRSAGHILQSVIATDVSLTPGERDFVQRLISGETVAAAPVVSGTDERLLITQKRAATLLSVNRVTIWRMTRDSVLHPVEVLPGMWRYSVSEIARLAQRRIGVPEKARAAKIALAA